MEFESPVRVLDLITQTWVQRYRTGRDPHRERHADAIDIFTALVVPHSRPRDKEESNCVELNVKRVLFETKIVNSSVFCH
jgi:hypothetical protein